MKSLLVIFLTFIVTTPVFAAKFLESDCDCNPPYAGAIGKPHNSGFAAILAMAASATSAGLTDKDFQRRGPEGMERLISIESDFKVPPIFANDKYFLHLYMGGNSIRYRDQVTAQRRRAQERRTGEYFNVPVTVASINGSTGTDLLNEHGAKVNVKNVGKAPFNLRTGGEVLFSIKSPGSTAITTARISVAINRGIPTTTLVSPRSGRVVFDTIKLRAGTFGIANGIKDVDFIRDGRVVYTYKMP